MIRWPPHRPGAAIRAPTTGLLRLYGPVGRIGSGFAGIALRRAGCNLALLRNPRGCHLSRPALKRAGCRTHVNQKPLNTRKHPPSNQCREWHCHSCDKDEPTEGYRLCYECGHMYETATDLVKAHRLFVRSYGGHPIEDPERIIACPLCCHDF